MPTVPLGKVSLLLLCGVGGFICVRHVGHHFDKEKKLSSVEFFLCRMFQKHASAHCRDVQYITQTRINHLRVADLVVYKRANFSKL